MGDAAKPIQEVELSADDIAAVLFVETQAAAKAKREGIPLREAQRECGQEVRERFLSKDVTPR